MTEPGLTDAMTILLLAGATRSSKLAVPFPCIRSPQEGAGVTRSRAELDRAAEGLLRRGYLERLPTNKHADVWREIRGIGPVTLKVTAAGEEAIRW